MAPGSSAAETYAGPLLDSEPVIVKTVKEANELHERVIHFWDRRRYTGARLWQSFTFQIPPSVIEKMDNIHVEELRDYLTSRNVLVPDHDKPRDALLECVNSSTAPLVTPPLRDLETDAEKKSTAVVGGVMASTDFEGSDGNDSCATHLGDDPEDYYQKVFTTIYPKGPSFFVSTLPGSLSGLAREPPEEEETAMENRSLFIERYSSSDMRFAGEHDECIQTHLRLMDINFKICKISRGCACDLLAVTLRDAALSFFLSIYNDTLLWEDAVMLLIRRYTSPERDYRIMREWMNLSLAKTRIEFPRKTELQCFDIFTRRLESMQLQLRAVYQTKEVLRDRLIMSLLKDKHPIAARLRAELPKSYEAAYDRISGSLNNSPDWWGAEDSAKGHDRDPNESIERICSDGRWHLGVDGIWVRE